MQQTFTVSEVVSTSWKYLKEQIWVLVGLFIGYYILAMILSFAMPSTSIAGIVITSLITYAISLVFILGYYKNIFQALDSIEPQFSAYGQQAGKILTLFIACIIVGIAISIGTALFIIPGIYLALRLQFFICFIVEENAGIMESIQKSWAITEGNVMQLFFLALAQIAIAIVGLLLLGIGILVASPLIYMTQCYVFRLLNNPLAVAEEVAQDVAEQI